METRSRPYTGGQDFMRLRLLLTEVRRRHGPGCWHVGDLAWRLFLHAIRYDLTETLHLWEDAEGVLLGFAIVSPPGAQGTVHFDLQLDPSVRGQGLEGQMLEWVETWRRRTMLETADRGSPRLATDTGVFDDDDSQLNALGRCGFSRSAAEGLLLLRALDGPTSAPTLPRGFVVRPVAGLHEAEERAAAHRDAFSPSQVTDQAYRRLMQTPDYAPELDLVAAAPDGSFAAFCIGWLDNVNRVGEFEPVGSRPAFRRMGLARAVLLDGLRRMKGHGMESVVIGPVPADDHAAVELYRSVGFHPTHRLYALTRNW
jgi:mycothiol synthase